MTHWRDTEQLGLRRTEITDVVSVRGEVRGTVGTQSGLIKDLVVNQENTGESLKDLKQEIDLTTCVV